MILNDLMDNDLLENRELEQELAEGVLDPALAHDKSPDKSHDQAPEQESIETTLFRSGEVIKRSGVSRQILYQYTAMGLVEEAQRTENGHRLYGHDIFDRLRLIRELNNSGYALKDIKEIFFSKGA